MPRPRTYAVDEVVDAAKDVFWRMGFEAAISDLEDATGIGRSSLYSAFGSKLGLFTAAVDRYTATFLDPLLGPIESGRPGLTAMTTFFARLGDAFVADPSLAQRGCIIVNSMASEGLEDVAAVVRFPTRLYAAFGRCLSAAAADGRIPRSTVRRRTRLLQIATIGLWRTVRSDPAGAKQMCESLRSEVASWDQVRSGPRERKSARDVPGAQQIL